MVRQDRRGPPPDDLRPHHRDLRSGRPERAGVCVGCAPLPLAGLRETFLSPSRTTTQEVATNYQKVIQLSPTRTSVFTRHPHSSYDSSTVASTGTCSRPLPSNSLEPQGPGTASASTRAGSRASSTSATPGHEGEQPPAGGEPVGHRLMTSRRTGDRGPPRRGRRSAVAAPRDQSAMPHRRPALGRAPDLGSSRGRAPHHDQPRLARFPSRVSAQASRCIDSRRARGGTSARSSDRPAHFRTRHASLPACLCGAPSVTRPGSETARS